VLNSLLDVGWVWDYDSSWTLVKCIMRVGPQSWMESRATVLIKISIESRKGVNAPSGVAFQRRKNREEHQSKLSLFLHPSRSRTHGDWASAGRAPFRDLFLVSCLDSQPVPALIKYQRDDHACDCKGKAGYQCDGSSGFLHNWVFLRMSEVKLMKLYGCLSFLFDFRNGKQQSSNTSKRLAIHDLSW